MSPWLFIGRVIAGYTDWFVDLLDRVAAVFRADPFEDVDDPLYDDELDG